MKITFLLTQSLESPSGLGRYWPLAKELVRLGHKVTILTLHHDYSSLKQRQFVKDGVKVHYVGQMHVKKIGSRKLYFRPHVLMWVATFAIWRLTHAALCISSDVYHVGKPHPMNSIAGILASKLQKKPMFLDCDDYEAVSNHFTGIWQKKIVAFFEDTVLRYATAITVNTRFTVQRLINLGYPVERIFYIPNGVDRQRFDDVDMGLVKKIKQQLGLTNNKVVLYIGSLSLSSHPVDLLIDAFAQVLPVIPYARLVLVGGGEDYEKLVQQTQRLGIANVTLFVGRVPPEQVPYYLYLADVTVDPVYDDEIARARSPLKIFESLAAGIPVITSDIGDRRALLGDSKLGVFVKPGDSRALADGLFTVLRNPDKRAYITQTALSCREQWYWDRLVKDFVQVYDKTI